MLNTWRIVIILGRAIHALCSSEVAKLHEDLDIVQDMFSEYDRNVRPNFNNSPINIIVDLYIESFGNIKEADMEYTVFGYFRQSWVDPRLAGRFNHSVVLKNVATDHAWTPDTFCNNARQSNLMMRGSDTDCAMNVHTNGTVFFTKRVKLVASCEMNLQDFPLDHQKCFLKFSSYGYKSSDVVYRWAKDIVDIERKTAAQFKCEETLLSERTAQYSTGNYSQLSISFTFHRSVGYYVMQVYAPDFLVVAISWTLFWMDKHDMNTRMAVGVTTILTIVFLLGSANASLPRVSYAKAIDWYLMVSFAFIFAALLECMLVFQFRSDKKKHDTKNKSSNKKTKFISGKLIALIKARMRRGSYRVDEEEIVGAAPNPTGQKSTTCRHKNTQINTDVEKQCKPAQVIGLSDRIDIASRYLFPISFVLFNIFYWFAYVYDFRVLPENARDI